MKLVTSFVHIVLYIPIERSIDRSMDIIHVIWPLWNPLYVIYNIRVFIVVYIDIFFSFSIFFLKLNYRIIGKSMIYIP